MAGSKLSLERKVKFKVLTLLVVKCLKTQIDSMNAKYTDDLLSKNETNVLIGCQGPHFISFSTKGPLPESVENPILL